MYNEKDDIEKLFSKKFEQFEISSSDSEWLELSSKLSKANFLKFSFATFNVYYLMVLVAFAGTATFTGINNSILENRINQQEEKIQTYQKRDTSLEKSAIIIDSVQIKVPAIQSSKPPKKELNQSQEIIEKEVKQEINQPTNEEKPVKDTAIKTTPIIPPLVDTISKSKVTRIKKTLIVKPRVVVKDTVIVTKPQK